MSDAILDPIPLNRNRDVYVRLDLSGVPWYIYNDHVDGYYQNDSERTSILIQKLTLDAATHGLMIGGVTLELPFDSSKGTQTSSDHSKDDSFIELGGSIAWHSSPNLTETSFIEHLRSFPSLSDAYRTVILEAEYFSRIIGSSSEEVPRQGLGDAVCEFEILVRVKGFNGAGTRDGNQNYDQKTIHKGQGSFRVVLKKLTEEHESRNGYIITNIDGAQLYQEPK